MNSCSYYECLSEIEAVAARGLQQFLIMLMIMLVIMLVLLLLLLMMMMMMLQ